MRDRVTWRERVTRRDRDEGGQRKRDLERDYGRQRLGETE